MRGASLRLALFAPHRALNLRWSSTAPASNEVPDPNPSRMKALWQRWKKYGWYGVGTLVAIDATTFGCVYVALSSGVDLIALLQAIPLPTEWMEEWLEGRQSAKKAGMVTLAFFVYKALAPVRIGATILLTPLVFRTLTGRDLEEEDEAARKKKD